MSTLRDRTVSTRHTSTSSLTVDGDGEDNDNQTTCPPAVYDYDSSLVPSLPSSFPSSSSSSSESDDPPPPPYHPSRAAANSAIIADSCLRFVPFICLFFLIFLSISLATTGTLTYGLGPYLGQGSSHHHPSTTSWSSISTFFREKILHRKPEKNGRAKGSGNLATNSKGGYGGITPPKRSKAALEGGANNPDPAAAAAAAPEVLQPLLVVERPKERDPNQLYLTMEELAQYDGKDGSPIFLAVYGRIFDVTEGKAFYGPTAGYRNLAGKDCSRAFATSCYNNKNLYDLRGLTHQQRLGIDHWYKFYSEHKKYRPVGWITDIPVVADDAPLPYDAC